jgi:hypothetical protein
MPFTIYQTTAEEIIGAIDAILQKKNGASDQMIADFLSTSLPNAQNAANMCVELGLATLVGTDYLPSFPYSNYIVTSNADQKAAVLRFILEEYEPFKIFKTRLKLNLTPDAAAAQTIAIFTLTAHRTEVTNTFISLGTYTNSLVAEGAGRYKPSIGNEYSFIKILNDVVHNRQTAELKIRGRLGEEICQWINANDVLNPLITAFQRAGEAHVDPRAPILHSGNAFESFLVQVAAHFVVNIVGANGINAKIDRITVANHLTTKHKNMVKYLGHVRNACDHGVDAEIGQTWTISAETSVEYVHVCLTAIRSVFDCIQGNYIL